MKAVCVQLGLRGDGAYNIVTTHGLRATMLTLPIEAGYDDVTVTLRTGHRDVKSLRNYHNLRCNIGFKQLKKMIGGSDGKNDGIKYKMVKLTHTESWSTFAQILSLERSIQLLMRCTSTKFRTRDARQYSVRLDGGPQPSSIIYCRLRVPVTMSRTFVGNDLSKGNPRWAGLKGNYLPNSFIFSVFPRIPLLCSFY